MSAFRCKADIAIAACLLLRSLSGVKRTWPVAAHMSASDPKRTLGTPILDFSPTRLRHHAEHHTCGGKVGRRGLVMRTTRKLIPLPRLFELPKCESCDSQMWLLEIEAVSSDGDRRTFECIDCKRLMIEVVDHRLAIS
jgi:hypothetical protein